MDRLQEAKQKAERSRQAAAAAALKVQELERQIEANRNKPKPDAVCNEEKKLPEGWRPLDLKIFEAISMLEAKQVITDRRFTEILELLKSQHRAAVAESELTQDMHRRLQKLNQVYYHVFPDRLEQDIRLQEQLNALNLKPAPDADPQKT
jgi:hypothetical protein